MIIALIDNGSLEPAAHLGLRAVAAELSARSGRAVQAVSWKHSARVPARDLGGVPAEILPSWLRGRLAAGEREFLFAPFLIQAEGAIGSAIRADLEALREQEGFFSFSFVPGLATAENPAALAGIAADRARETIAAARLRRPPVVLVDHGGPARISAALRDAAAREARTLLAGAAGAVAAASMESPEGPEFAFNRPLLAELLARPGFDRGDVVIVPLFLAPGRHAGPGGDLARIAREAEARAPGLRCHFTGLVGDHPATAAILARRLSEALSLSTVP